LGNVVRGKNLTCYACAVLANHVHLLVRRHRIKAQEMIPMFMTAGRDALIGGGRCTHDHPVWSRDFYVRYEDTPKAVHTTINYISRNFAKHRITPQTWDFITLYNNWPFHKK